MVSVERRLGEKRTPAPMKLHGYPVFLRCIFLALPARPGSQPEQTKDVIRGIPQPGRDFFGLKRLVFGAKLAIDQLCDFLSRAWLSDLVQRPPDVFIKAIRIVGRAHLRSSGWETNLLRGLITGVWCNCHLTTAVTRNWTASTGESIYESPQVCALRQRRPKYTSAQSHSAPQFAFPNSRSPAIRQ